MGGAVSGAKQGGSRCMDLEVDLHGGGLGGHDIRVVDVGNDTVHWEGFGQIPPQGGPKADRETTSERTRW